MIRPIWSTKGSFEAVMTDETNSTVTVHVPLFGASRTLTRGGYRNASRAATRLARRLEATETKADYIAMAEAWYARP